MIDGFDQSIEISFLQRDAVRSEDVRIELVKHRLAVVEENSIEKDELEHELAQLYHVRRNIFFDLCL